MCGKELICERGLVYFKDTLVYDLYYVYIKYLDAVSKYFLNRAGICLL